jgi:hypothetical protein
MHISLSGDDVKLVARQTKEYVSNLDVQLDAPVELLYRCQKQNY